MADQRPFGRFRLPWLSAVTAPQPQPQLQTQTTRPIEIVAPPQPQRPPFRPAGIAQVQPPAPPPPPSPPRAATETQISAQPASPSRATTRTRAASVPPSPSRATTQAKAASLPPSPSRATSEAPVVSQTRSPSRTAPQPRAASVPPSPTRATAQPQPTPKTIPQRPSSTHSTSQILNQISSPSSPPKRVTQLQPTVSQPSQFPPPPPSQPAEPKPVEDKKNGPAKVLPAQTREHKKTTTAGSSGEQIKTVSSTRPKPRNKLTESHQKLGMANGEQVPLQKEIKDDITKFVHKLATGQLKYPMDDKPVSIVTIAGENRGASMHLGSEPVRKEGPVHIHRGYKLNPDDSIGTTTDAEESRKGKEPQNSAKEEPVKKAFLNSNTQSINNSMVLESSVNEGSAGIHLVLSENLAEPIKSESLETHKAEVSVTPAQKLTYDPTIRRRCLRGLFLESSDSDPDNPEKPRRHGCRYNCGQMSKDKDIGIF